MYIIILPGETLAIFFCPSQPTNSKEPTDLNALADEYLRLNYHDLRAKDSNFNAQMVTDFDPAVGMVQVIPQDIGRVFLNIINNAFYVVAQRKKTAPDGFDPTVSLSSCHPHRVGKHPTAVRGICKTANGKA